MLKLLQLAILAAVIYFFIRSFFSGKPRAPAPWYRRGDVWMGVMAVIAVLATIYWVWVRLTM